MQPLNIGFDLDGVLIRNPFETCVIPRLQVLLAGLPGVRGKGEEVVAKTVRERIVRGWRARMATGDLAAAYDWDAIYHEVAGDLGADRACLDDIDVAAWVRDCCDQSGHIEALPGAADLLARLDAAGHRLVVISNGYAAYQRPVLAALGLLGRFADVVTPDRVGYAKPDSRIFAAAAPLDVFVGDTLVHDVLGAKRAGLATVWVAPVLPAELARLEPLERAAHPRLAGVIRDYLSVSPHSRYHPEADERSCLPNAVVKDMRETTELLLGWRLAPHGAAGR
ncbi:MAG TPA: HAD family hydrolase [Trueperaceae bacterium]|nr:HAD family hydrolase [Trueperaceae bacterium]